MDKDINFKKEVTVEVDTDLNNLIELLNRNKFILKQEYDVFDTYMVKNSTNLTDNIIDILNNCILIRNIITNDKNIKCITYKYRECDTSGDIIKNGKVNCYINSLDGGVNLFKALGYRQLLILSDHIMVYSNDETEFSIQIVDNKHIYIEIEEDNEFVDKHYENTQEMKDEFKK